MTDKRPHLIPGIGWRYATEHSMLRRLDGHDYKGRMRTSPRYAMPQLSYAV